jgi:hypothetical protein
MLSRLFACFLVLAAVGLAAPEAAAQSSTERSETRSRRGASSEAQATRRPRSAAQLANDQRMRQCGAEWRGMSTAQRGSRTWRTFMPECNRRLRGAETPARSRGRSRT